MGKNGDENKKIVSEVLIPNEKGGKCHRGGRRFENQWRASQKGGKSISLGGNGHCAEKSRGPCQTPPRHLKGAGGAQAMIVSKEGEDDRGRGLCSGGIYFRSKNHLGPQIAGGGEIVRPPWYSEEEGFGSKNEQVAGKSCERGSRESHGGTRCGARGSAGARVA